MATLWVRPICDNLLSKVKAWGRAWPTGKVAATRPLLHKSGQIEDVVTMRAVEIAWHPKEFETLVRLLKALKPEWSLTVDFNQFQTTIIRSARLLPGGYRLTEMAVFEQDIKDLVSFLEDVRANRGAASKEIEQGTFWDKV